MPRLLLIDNGSSRPDSTLSLRRLAAALEVRLGESVAPVSLLHSDKIPAADLGGRPADTLAAYLKRAAAQGERDLVAVPLFFGPSRALLQGIPDTAAALAEDLGPIRVRVAPPLCPLPQGEPRLVRILADQVSAAAGADRATQTQVILVDHGSPVPEVNAVRRWLAPRLADTLASDWSGEIQVQEAVMERRPGAEYDFNGDLLETVLADLAATRPQARITLALLFIAPGRHAGPGGDIAAICQAAEARHPGLHLLQSALVGTHQLLVEILADRARGVLAEPPSDSLLLRSS